MLNDASKVDWRDAITHSLKLRNDFLLTFLQNDYSLIPKLLFLEPVDLIYFFLISSGSDVAN
jgi:hypothetical protein